MARILAAAAAAAAVAERGGGGGGGGGGAGARSPPTTASFFARDLDTRVSDSRLYDLSGGVGELVPVRVRVRVCSDYGDATDDNIAHAAKAKGDAPRNGPDEGAASAAVESRRGHVDPLECRLPAAAVAGASTAETVC